MQRIRNIAYEFFIQQGLKLPLDFEQLSKVAKNKGWEMYAYSEAERIIRFLESRGHMDIRNKKGFAYKPPHSDEPPIIVYKDELSCMEKVGIICHEMAHIVIIGHSSFDGVLGKSESHFIENAQEKEADIFMLELQAPIPILKQMDITSVNEIVKRGILNRIDAAKQIMQMRKQDISKRAGFIFASVAVLSALWVSSLFNQPGVLGSGNNPTETTTAYIRQIGNGSDSTSATIALDDEQKSRIVQVTKSGEKYHKPDCRYVKDNNSAKELTLGEAADNGYEACKVCRPDLK